MRFAAFHSPVIIFVVIDYNAALERVGGDQELLKEIAQLFLSEYPKDLEAISRAIDGGNAKDLERAAHNLKGAVLNFGAEPTREAALQLEMIGRKGDLAEAPAAFQLLQKSLLELRPFLEAISR